jgi:hypothetical protein
MAYRHPSAAWCSALETSGAKWWNGGPPMSHPSVSLLLIHLLPTISTNRSTIRTQRKMMGLSCVGTTEPHEPPPLFFSSKWESTPPHNRIYIYYANTHTWTCDGNESSSHREKRNRRLSLSLDSPHLSPSPFGPPAPPVHQRRKRSSSKFSHQRIYNRLNLVRRGKKKMEFLFYYFTKYFTLTWWWRHAAYYYYYFE